MRKGKPKYFYCSEWEFKRDVCESQCPECEEWQHSLEDSVDTRKRRIRISMFMFLSVLVLATVCLHKAIYLYTLSASLAANSSALFFSSAFVVGIHLIIRRQ